MIAVEVLLVSLVGGVMAMDRTAALQVMISRPVVAAPAIGLLLGDPATGLKVGLIIELLWIGHLPVGASLPPDETVVSILVTAISVWCGRFLDGAGEGVIALTTALVIPAAVIAQRIDSRIRQMNIASAHKADSLAGSLDLDGVQRECMKGVGRFYMGYASMLLLFLSAGTAAVCLVYPFMPEFVLTGLERFNHVLPVIGVVSVLSMARVKNSLGFFLLSFALVFGLIEVL